MARAKTTCLCGESAPTKKVEYAMAVDLKHRTTYDRAQSCIDRYASVKPWNVGECCADLWRTGRRKYGLSHSRGDLHIMS